MNTYQLIFNSLMGEIAEWQSWPERHIETWVFIEIGKRKRTNKIARLNIQLVNVPQGSES